ILPDRRKDTIKRYFQRYGWNVEIVVMDMSSSFRAAIEEAIERPIIIADRFHFVRYVYWNLDTVRRTVQKTWHAYNRKSIKRSRNRKSTRLNSSHVSISYAVFCLKKKIKKT